MEHVKHKREFAPIADKVARQIGRVDRLTVHDRERIRDACDIVTMSDLDCIQLDILEDMVVGRVLAPTPYPGNR